ncbi:MAG: PspC domain-containing protein [Acidimicrobiia bacterium]
MEPQPIAAQAPGRGSGGRRRTAFVSLTVAFAAFLYLFSPFSSLFLGWFVDFDDNISHRVHEITFGMLLAMVLVGVIVQLRSPERHIAGMQQAVAVVLILTVVVTASTGWEWTTLIYLVPAVTIAMLHPSRQEIFRPRVSPAGGLLFLMVMLTLPALIAFSEEFDKAANNVRFHQSHWGGMAAFGLALLATGYLAALRVRGWPLAAWTTGLSMVVYGIASLRFRFDASARPYVGGVLVLMWAVAWLVTAERARLREARSPVVSVPGTSADTPVAPELRRARRGRLIGGVAAGVARYLGVTVLFVRILFVLSAFFLVGLLYYIVLWVRIPLEAAGDIAAAPTGVVSPALAKRRTRVAAMAPALGLALLLGVCSTGLADSIAPPVPHSIESASQGSCLECHGTGDEEAPVIDPFTHNAYPVRHFSPFCGECHDLPTVQPAFEAAGDSAVSFGDYAMSDGFRQDHPEMFALDEDDMARLVSLTRPQGVGP